MLIAENYTPDISFQNIFNLLDTKGKIVGAIHVIIPIKTEKENTYYHLTNFFFSSGYNHVCNGFAVGYTDGAGEDQFAKVMGLEVLLSTIIGLAPTVMSENLLCKLSLDSESKEWLEKNEKPLYYVFRSPESARTSNLLTLPGYHVLMQCVENLKNEEEKVVMIGAQDE
jgi:hypothetical protein